MQPKSIIHAVTTLDVGGLERIVVDLSRIQVLSGIKVVILCRDHLGLLADIAIQNGVTVLSLNKPPGRDYSLCDRIASIIDEFAPAIIHTHQIGAVWYIVKPAHDKRVPIIHTEHGNIFAIQTNYWRLLRSLYIYYSVSSAVSKICCVSQEIYRALSRSMIASKSQLCVIPNGIDTDKSVGQGDTLTLRHDLNIPLDATVVGTVGRLDEVKQQDQLLLAVSRIPDLYCIIVGEGPYRSALEEVVNRYNLSDRVILAGYQSEPHCYIAAMDIFTLTSRSEGFPVTLLEAWLQKKPVICTAVGGIPDIVHHGRDALLYPSGNLAALVRHIEYLIANPLIGKQVGQSGYQTVVDQYSLDNMAARYAEYYNEVIL